MDQQLSQPFIYTVRYQKINKPLGQLVTKPVKHKSNSQEAYQMVSLSSTRKSVSQSVTPPYSQQASQPVNNHSVSQSITMWSVMHTTSQSAGQAPVIQSTIQTVRHL